MTEVTRVNSNVILLRLLPAGAVKPEGGLHLFEFALVVLIGDHEGQREVPLHPTSSFTKQRMLRLTNCGFHPCRQTGKEKQNIS